MKAKHARHRADAIRAQRLQTIRRIVEIANERCVDFVIIAGDQFEDSAPALNDIATVVATLRLATMPVFVLPGNHDPARVDSPYSATSWMQLEVSRVTTVRVPSFFEVPGGVLLASPCEKRYSIQDPTAVFRDMPSADGAIRVGCAHGTLQIGPIPAYDEGDQRGGYPIATDAASRAGLAYLGLGHWHSYLEFVDAGALIAYSGTPEATSYSDSNCGTVSIVEIDGPGATPRIERVPVGQLSWHEERFEISDDESLRAAVAKLQAIADPKHAVVKARFRGVLSPRQLEVAAVESASFEQSFFSYEKIDELEPRPENAQAWRTAFDTALASEVASELADLLSGENAAIALRALARLREVSR